MPPRAAVVVSALHSNLDEIIKQLYYHAATFLLQRLFSQSSQLSYTVSASDKKLRVIRSREGRMLTETET
jgi:hypothetical protein